MDKKVNETYPINKYSKAVIGGLGYDVILAESDKLDYYHLQGVDKIVNGKTGEPLHSEFANFVYDYNESDRMLDIDGTTTRCFKCDDGKEIRLEVYGDTIIKDKNLRVFLHYNHRNDGDMRIKISIDGESDVEILFNSSKTHNRTEIVAKVLGYDDIVHIYQNRDLWADSHCGHDYEEFSADRLYNCILFWVIRFNKGEYCCDEMKQALKIIKPALRLYAIDFLKEWKSSLLHRIKKERQEKRNKQTEIDVLTDKIEQHDREINYLNEIRKALSHQAFCENNALKRK